MTYFGKNDLREIAPNHPFAHTCVIPRGLSSLRLKPQLPRGQHGVIAAVRREDDWHAIVISPARWHRIRQGEKVLSRARRPKVPVGETVINDCFTQNSRHARLWYQRQGGRKRWIVLPSSTSKTMAADNQWAS